MVILLVPLCYVGLGVTVILLVPLCYVDLGVTVILLVPLCYVGLGVTVILLVPLCYVDLGVTVINRAFVLSVIGAGYDTLPQSVHANRNYMCEVIMMQAVTSAGTGASAGEQNWNLGIEIF